jgi:hypothetical protein
MAEYKEVRHERLWLKAPGSDKLRKTAAARLRYLLNTGWRETERWDYPNYVTLRVERSGHAPLMTKLPKPPPQQPRPPRQGNRPGQRGGFGGSGGFGGRSAPPPASPPAEPTPPPAGGTKS